MTECRTCRLGIGILSCGRSRRWAMRAPALRAANDFEEELSEFGASAIATPGASRTTIAGMKLARARGASPAIPSKLTKDQWGEIEQMLRE